MSDHDPVPFIIELIAQDVVRDSASGRPGKGVDLSGLETELRELLHDAREAFAMARDDWETRRDPDKPPRHLPAELREGGEGFPDWDDWYNEVYQRPRGNPGKGRTRDLPVEPLHAVYAQVRSWWLRHVGGGFNPTYPRADIDADGNRQGQRSDTALFNPAGRLFLLVAQEIDHRYTPRICYGVHETARQQRQRRRRSE